MKQDIPLIGPILNKIIGSRNDRFVKKYLARATAINALEPKFRKLSDKDLRGQVEVFRARIDKGESAADVMAEAFAVAREAMDRSVGIRQIFNPAREFDPSTLPASVQDAYARTKAAMEATPECEPDGEWLGHEQMIPGWQQVDIPNEIYEAVRELYPESRPPYRARPFDVQLIGAMVLYQGRISEMKTGEGKTIVAPLATYLACIERLKVHVVTVNDYLVQRDRDWTAPYFHALGLTVGAIHPQHMQPEDMKRRMYMCDVVYGTTSEFGFDYLRDNMKRSVDQQVQRRRDFAIVDEVDSILIDEARTPLIISGPAHEGKPRYDMADKLAKHLVDKQKPWQAAEDAAMDMRKRIKGLEGDIRNTRDKAKIPEFQAEIKEMTARLPGVEAEKKKHMQYYETHLERKSVHLTHDGVAEAQRVAGMGSFYVGENMDVPHLLEQALRAHVVYQRDKDYIIGMADDPQTGQKVPSVIIVDISTGRPMYGRQWSDGLHQAVEAKEAVPIKQETQTVATITIQNFFKMYKRLAGMTGTADTEAQEFHDIYKLDVVAIPTNKPVTRRDFDDMVFVTGKDKWSFIVEEIKNFHDCGRPVLVGTTSVEKSEMLAEMLQRKYGIRHEVLNAKQHEREASIVESAGQIGAVMIATNMAGRGTDIKLGKLTREQLLDHWLRRGIAPREVTIETPEEKLRELVYRKIAPQEKDLGLNKRDVETMDWPTLETTLLRHWAMKNTWLSDKDVARMNNEQLRKELDRNNRFLLHRIHWFTSIEDLGGLHVIGTERHESRRIDNQLRGRSGRQGDKGSSRFFISLEDELMKLFAGDGTLSLLSRIGMKEGDAIEHPMLSKSVERAQRKVEETNFQRRKNILEYDEVMEHQRRGFYSLRQRALEGRDMKGLIFEYIRDAAAKASGEFLSPDYAATCASNLAQQMLRTEISARQLRGIERDEMELRIRRSAKEEARNSINLHLGEYFPEVGGQIEMDFDAQGLINWARNTYGVEMSEGEFKNPSSELRRSVRDRIIEASEQQIDATDLSPIEPFLDKTYGSKAMSVWAKEKFLFDIAPEKIEQARAEGGNEAVLKLVVDEASGLYRKREIEYPIDLMVETVQNMMRARMQDQAVNYFITWANNRYKMGWTPDTLKSKHPTQARKELTDAAYKAFENGMLEQAVQDALKCDTDDKLAAHLAGTYQQDLPLYMQRLSGEERTNAIRAKIESILRSELIYLERSLLLEILDGLWKDHLYAMEKLRDGISFRAYSQLDPRIEYKREGARMFLEMMDNVRERVTDAIFKVRLQAPVIQPPPQPRAMPRPAAMPATGGMLGGDTAGDSGGLYVPPSSGRPAADAPPTGPSIQAQIEPGPGGLPGEPETRI